MSTPVWITATPPTPNGDLHIGHIAGPYVAGDVLRRFLAADGTEVRYTTGLDDHQSYVPVRGLKDGGRTGEEVADSYGASIARVWQRAEVGFDRVVRPREEDGYLAYVQDFLRRLHDAGHVVARTRPLPYCAPCERWLYEAYLTGKCPHCGSSSNGNACEPCGRPNDCADLGEPRCTICDTPAEIRDAARLYFPLAPLADRLEAFWAEVDMPPHLRALCDRMLAHGLPEIAVSHPGEWGVPVTVPGFEDQRAYVWFEMAPGYLWELPEQEREKGDWPAPVQFFGFDNGYFHAVLFPALYAALHPGAALARTFVVNEFYQLDGAKFSTSRRHAIWVHEALAEAGSDVLRHHVLADRPNGRQTSFTRADLERTQALLTAQWNGWLERLFAAVARHSDGRVPEERPEGPAWQRLRAWLERTVAELREAYGVEGFDTRRVIALLDEIVAGANDFWYVHEHERDRSPSAHRAALTAQLAVAGALSAWAAPVMPAGAARLAALLGEDTDRAVDAAALTPPPAGRPLTVPDRPVFGD
ncbi:methionine--tRNA ligase [Streptomyces antioxidans]|uniref:methionine--tRNA ligase n=1 Tax=Streptomyces antioxidans TaxID=1507734 RepID=A0A1V4DBV3_9ACTN|nr:class I tRNA ligase family protein [Streptomyces antioxidans]OPF83758.1 methionine--tRNA ligase [Streptomyces antioxidans]